MNVEHDPEKGRFFIRLDGEEAYLVYTKRGSLLDFSYVFVPPAHRGKSHAGRLLIEGFEYAKREGFGVIPTCPFIAHEFLPRFPQYRELVNP
jgi:uncharacterized protein